MNRITNALFVFLCGVSLVLISNRLGFDGTDIGWKSGGLFAASTILAAVLIFVGRDMIRGGQGSWQDLGYCLGLVVVGGYMAAFLVLRKSIGSQSGWAILLSAIIALQTGLALGRRRP
jgi:hypothetical protein